MLKMPSSSQLEDLFESKRSPLEDAQFDGALAKTESEQPYSDSTTIDSGDAVDTKTLTYCSGVPTRRKKLLHGPSLPSLYIRSVNYLSHHIALGEGLQVLTGRNHDRRGGAWEKR